MEKVVNTYGTPKRRGLVGSFNFMIFITSLKQDVEKEVSRFGGSGRLIIVGESWMWTSNKPLFPFESALSLDCTLTVGKVPDGKVCCCR